MTVGQSANSEDKESEGKHRRRDTELDCPLVTPISSYRPLTFLLPERSGQQGHQPLRNVQQTLVRRMNPRLSLKPKYPHVTRTPNSWSLGTTRRDIFSRIFLLAT